ncbi:transglycosylase SLT domain-containing protein [Methylobacter sp. S3L5C]|uniref:transglycosylase SLT domain-containing protein n=1 Tax=Methylobacter sp. S3L5C TaxID=2839024 RepID=UPI001FACF39E|nr:transglycosylase SLT domain-containing protein [Methylobacter sp. S3L5C]UOA08111.1 transglycosylase SLT domain-containing protein [Methylobacter sp. S3L5C]
MRLLVLVLNLLVGSILLTQSTHILAASMEIEANKNNIKRGNASHLRVKNKKNQLSRVKQNNLTNPGNVWERIRIGMKIPRPRKVEAISNQLLVNNNILPVRSFTERRLHTRISINHETITTLNTHIISAPDDRINPTPHFTVITRSQRVLALQKLKLPVTASAPVDKSTPYGRLKLNATLSSRIRDKVESQEQSVSSRSNTLHEDSAYQIQSHSGIEFHPRLHQLDLKNPSDPLINSNLPPLKTVKTNLPDKAAITAYTSAQDSTVLTPNHDKEAIKYDRVNKHVVWYTQHHDYLLQVSERARPYLYHIVESLSEHKLPYELALLPIVESAYQATALSPKSAAGLWQFIPSTGHDFDLPQSEKYDGRLDITASTQAAMRYMSFLNQHFKGDWLLALAAYNCGLGAVDNAVSRNIVDGLDTDYWSLRLPEETQEYVPRLLALSSIFANPDAHGLKLAQVRNEPYFVKVKIERKHDIDYLAEKDFREVAQLANLSYEQFSRLNPGYLNSKLAVNGPFTLLMPAANANQLHQQLASIAQFMNKPPTMAAINGPLKRRAPLMFEGQKTVLSRLIDLSSVKDKNPVSVSEPFLSLILNTNQTTPRLATQSGISPIDLNPDTKRVEKNI